jgi:peptidyl-prolyl cis-trans isomerase B (cyclophilin B)
MFKKFALAAALVSGFIFFSAINTEAQVKKAPVKKTVPAKKTPTSRISTIRTTKVVPVAVIPGTRVKLTTDSGVIVIRLYDKTPKHRDNFIKLVNDHFFDSLLFHRVIQGFMIQGGDPNSKYAAPGMQLGMGGTGYTIPAEFDTSLFHKRGVLAAARDNNPERASSGCQFYIVQGRTYSDAELNGLEQQMGMKFSAEKRKAYKTIGGTPFLDMNYTVFGEVEKGIEVVDKIAAVPKDGGDRPIGDVRMKMEIIK